MWAVKIKHGQNTASINWLHLQGPKNSLNPKRWPVSHKSERRSLEHQPNSHNTYTGSTYHPAKFYVVAQVSLCSMGTHMTPQRAWEEGIWLLESSVQRDPWLCNSPLFLLRKLEHVQRKRCPGCCSNRALSGCTNHWQQLTGPTRCAGGHSPEQGRAPLLCCERSCADSSVLPWKSLMREGQMGSLGVEQTLQKEQLP